MEHLPASGAVVFDLISRILPRAASWGIVPASPESDARARYESWLAEGLHAGMPCLVNYAHLKFAPDLVVPGAASLIILALPYPAHQVVDPIANTSAAFTRQDRAAALDPPSSHADTSAVLARQDRAAHQAGHAPAKTPAIFSSQETACEPVADLSGLVARVSRGRDYHKVMQGMLRKLARELALLFPGGVFRPICDTVPLSERHYAHAAGLGTLLDNCLLGNQELGTDFVLGAVISTIALPPRDAGQALDQKICAGCARCRSACPTGALLGPKRLEISRCIAWLTIENRGLIDPELWPAIGRHVFGCDVCQDVCPINSFQFFIKKSPASIEGCAVSGMKPDLDGPASIEGCAVSGMKPDLDGQQALATLYFGENATGPHISLEVLLSLVDDDDVRHRFSGTALLRAGRTGLVRNAIIALTNILLADPDPLAGDGVWAQVANLTEDTDHVVRETALQALTRLARG